MNGDALILENLADRVSSVEANAARRGAQALRDADARQPHLRALLDELGAADVREAVVKARKLKEANGV